MTEPTVPQYHFEIDSLIDQVRYKPARVDSFHSFLEKWFAANDSIIPEFIKRADWVSSNQTFHLEKMDNGKQKLVLPQDLKLWEIGAVIDVIDSDTFAKKTEKILALSESRNQLNALFVDSAAYLAKHLDEIIDREGNPDLVAQGIAKALAEEIGSYGLALKSGEKTPASIDELKQLSLTAEREEEVERWLVGNEFYEARKQLAEKRGVPLDALRHRTLAQFFGVARKAFELENLAFDEDLSRPSIVRELWESEKTAHNAFIQKVRALLSQQIFQPRDELVNAISRRGAEKLLTEMKSADTSSNFAQVLEKLGFPVDAEVKTLQEKVNTPKLKAELTAIRETNDPRQIGRKQQDIALLIQREVSKLKYETNIYEPSNIISRNTLNCTGFSAVAGALFHEVGLDYLTVSTQTHSVLLLTTADNRVFWNEMQSVSSNIELTDSMLEGKNRDGTALKAQDLASASRDKSFSGGSYLLKNRRISRELGESEEQIHINCLSADLGAQTQLLDNLASHAYEENNRWLSVEIFRQLASRLPDIIDYQVFLADAYEQFDQTVESAEECQKILQKDPNNVWAYLILADDYLRFGKKDEMKKLLDKAVNIGNFSPNQIMKIGNIYREAGEKSDALKWYTDFLKAATHSRYTSTRKTAESRIKELTTS